MSGAIDKTFRPLVKHLRELGCEVEPSPGRGNNHWRVLYQGRRVMSLPTSLSSRAGVYDAVRQLRRNGVPISPRWPRG